MSIREAQKLYKKIGKMEKLYSEALNGIQFHEKHSDKTVYEYALMIVKACRTLEKIAEAMKIKVDELLSNAKTEDDFVIWVITNKLMFVGVDTEEQEEEEEKEG